MKTHLCHFLFYLSFSSFFCCSAMFGQSAEKPRIGDTIINLPLDPKVGNGDRMVHTEYFLISEGDGATFEDLTEQFYFPDFSPTAPHLPPDDIISNGDHLYVNPGNWVNLFYQSPDGIWLSVRGEND